MLTLPQVIIGSLLIAFLLGRLLFGRRKVRPAVFFSVWAVSNLLFAAGAILFFWLPDDCNWIVLAMLMTSNFYLVILEPVQNREAGQK